MAGAERTHNLTQMTVEKLYDSKNDLSKKLDEIKVDIERIRNDIIKQKEDINQLLKSKANKARAKRRIVTELSRRRNDKPIKES